MKPPKQLQPGTDYAAARLLIQLCKQAVSDGAALLIVTHEPERFAAEANVIYTMNKGQLSYK